MDTGYRESTESWAETLRDLHNRGLEAPLVAAGDGALGLWAALDEVYPTTEHQRCWKEFPQHITRATVNISSFNSGRGAVSFVY